MHPALRGQIPQKMNKRIGRSVPQCRIRHVMHCIIGLMALTHKVTVCGDLLFVP